MGFFRLLFPDSRLPAPDLPPRRDPDHRERHSPCGTVPPECFPMPVDSR